MGITPHTRELLELFGLTETDLEMNRHGRLSDTQHDQRVAFARFRFRFFTWCKIICGILLLFFFGRGLFYGWKTLEDTGALVLALAIVLYLSYRLSLKAENHLEQERGERTSVIPFDAKVNITRYSPPGQRPSFKITSTNGRVINAGAALPALYTGISYRFYEYKNEAVSVEALEEPSNKSKRALKQ